jgi:acyl carrier protein
MSVEVQVKDILLQILDVDEKDLTLSAHLRQNLKASSVDLVEILAALENEFDIEISDEEAQDLLTVQAIVDYVAKFAA